MNVHLSLAGEWVECTASERACPRLYHLPDTTAAEANAMPRDVLLPLFNAIDPPTFTDGDGTRFWHDESGLDHRDYDLPSTILASGDMEWWRHGIPHRDGDKPALVSADGKTSAWWFDGVRHREHGPAFIQRFSTDESQWVKEWWYKGHQMSEESHRTRVAAQGKRS